MKSKEIPNFKGRYSITREGVIYDTVNRRVVPQTVGVRGYTRAKLMVEGVGYKEFMVHRLVALTYIPNPKNLKVVNHIDGDKTNCNVINLEWVSHSDNNRHANLNGLSYSKPRVDNKFGATGIKALQNGKYIGYVSFDKKQFYTKVHNDLDEAIKDRLKLKLNKVKASVWTEAIKTTAPLQKTLRVTKGVLDTTDELGSKIDDAKDAYESVTGKHNDNIPTFSIKKQAQNKATEKVEKSRTYHTTRANINRNIENGKTKAYIKYKELKDRL